MNYVEKYGAAVTDGKIVACEKIKREYDRLLEDIAHPGRWHMDTDIGARPIEFIESFCKQSKGQIGAPLKLELFQKAKIQAAFGFVDDDNIRRFNEAINVVGRKNGKTTDASGIALYMATSDHEGAPEVDFVATSKDQAKIGFDECNNMRIQSHLLKKHLRKRMSDLYNDDNLGFIRPLASNTNALDGLNAHCAIIDELAAVKNRDLYDLIKQSMSARKQPMLWEISTNGYVRDSIFDAQYNYAAGIISGDIKDDRVLPLIYELDDIKEWTSPEMWIKANPGLGKIKKREFLEGCVEKAKVDDTFRSTVLVKDFNLKQNAANAWMNFEDLDNTETFKIKDMGFNYGIGGFDAADSVDLNAAKMICKKRDSDKLYVAQMYWIPQSKLDLTKNRRHPDDAPYELWQSRGLLRVTEGNRVNKKVILDWFLEMRDTNDVYPLYIGYDPWHIEDSLLEQFKYAFGKPVMVPVRQGTQTLSQPMKDLKAEFQAKLINYNNNPIDKWCLANTYAKTDINENIQPDKGAAATQRIDGTAALLDAYTVYRDKKDEFESLIK